MQILEGINRHKSDWILVKKQTIPNGTNVRWLTGDKCIRDGIQNARSLVGSSTWTMCTEHNSCLSYLTGLYEVTVNSDIWSSSPSLLFRGWLATLQILRKTSLHFMKTWAWQWIRSQAYTLSLLTSLKGWNASQHKCTIQMSLGQDNSSNKWIALTDTL